MTRQQAVKKLEKVYGKRMAYRVKESAPTEPDREKAGEALRQMNALKRALDADIESRRQWLLSKDETYTQMVATREKMKKDMNEAMGIRMGYKFQAGYISSVMGAFCIEAEGDTWEQVFDVLAKKYPAGKATAALL